MIASSSSAAFGSSSFGTMALGAEAERLVLGEIGVPLFGELRVVREIVALPVHDCLVVLARKLALLVGHGTPPRSVLTK